MTSAGKDPSKGENQIEAKESEVVGWQTTNKEESIGATDQRQTSKEEQDIIFIHTPTTEEPRRRFVFEISKF